MPPLPLLCRPPASRAPLVLAFSLFATAPLRALLDDDRNGMSDIWEELHEVRFLDPHLDLDGDGLSNLEEARIGSDPRDPASGLFCVAEAGFRNRAGMRWHGVPGRHYYIEQFTDPAIGWTTMASYDLDTAGEVNYAFPQVDGARFFRLNSGTGDLDEDGLDDWEERLIGLDPEERYTGRWHRDDDDRVRLALRSPNVVTVSTLRGSLREDWPGTAVVAVRRSGGLRALTVALSWAGSASAGSDYVGRVTEVTLAAGQNEVLLELTALADTVVEGDEAILVSVLPGTDYTARLGAASIEIVDTDSAGLPGPAEAGRFLSQATFGPTPADLAAVERVGIEGWLEEQFTRPLGLHQPILEAWGQGYYVGTSQKMLAWWKQAVQGPDPLRQRVAFALSEIFVISDSDGALRGQPMGMANYYDMLLANAFGNFRDLLRDVTLHPCMGRYLSHVQNMAPDAAGKRFPDENFAREIMQLFTIGMWELHPDGREKLDTSGQPIPTYDNDDVRELARVFTGLNYEGNNTAQWWRFFSPRTNMLEPMRMWDGPYDVWNDTLGAYEVWWFHDPDEKHLLGGTVIPAGQRGMEDIEMALDSLFEHPNVGPFMARLLIQRLVKSNPTPAYIGRVAAAFADNGRGVRGDLRAVVEAILLDPEARDPAWLEEPTHGKLHEPYLRLVKLARALEARSPSGWFPLWSIGDQFGMQPMSSPSVFNFFQPDFAPNGEIKERGLFAPEFQLTTDDLLFRNRNQFYSAAYNYFNRWIGDEPEMAVRADYSEALSVADDPDGLVAFLDRRLLQGTGSPRELAIVSAAVRRINEVDLEDRVATAVYLLSTSTSSAVLR